MAAEMRDLDKAAILGAADLPLEKVEVPEWGGGVWIRPLTLDERDQFENWTTRRQDGDRRLTDCRGGIAKMVIACVVDARCERVFQDNEVEHLQKKSARAVQRIYARIVEQNGLSAEAVDGLKKNSDAAQNGASASG